MRALLSLCLVMAVRLTLGNSTVPYVFLDTARHTYSGARFQVLEDSASILSAAEAIISPGFRPLDRNVPNLGVTNSTFWLTTTILNRSSSDHLFLCVEYAELDELELWLLRDEQLIRWGFAGQSVAPLERTGTDTEFSFDIPIPKGEQGTLLLRVRSNKQIQLPLVFRTAKELTSNRSRRNLILGVYIGVMLVLALYNTFIFASIRDRSYLYYVLYLLVVALTQLAFIGIGPFYIWAGNNWLSSSSTLIFTLLTATLGMQFARHFIGTKQYVPRLDRGAPIFYLLFAACIGLQQAGQPVVAYQVAQALSGWSALYTLIVGVLSWRRGSRQAGFFLVAWTVFLLAVVVFVVKDLGVLPYNDWTTYAMPVGSAVEGILLSFGLADRINVLRREKERSQAEALAASIENQRIIREQNVILEQKVTERTQALQESNEHLKRTQTQLVNAEKMASLGQLTAGIAHEINNPINFITSNIQPLRRNISEIVEVMQEYRALTPETAMEKLKLLKERERKLGISDSIEELDDIIGSISEGSKRTAEIVRGLRNFSRLDEDDLKDSDIHEGLKNTLALLAPQYRDKVRIRFELGELPPIECFPGKVNQVFMNILTNAIQATLARGADDVSEVVVTTRAEDGTACISIADNGIGMSEEVKARMFDPFFTTKPVGEGTGLGLAIVYGIIQDHYGHIAVESAPDKGTTIHIHLPIRHLPQQKRA
ncbi:MAG: GHKL domain-containing protein [Flavobacteriales bacterium]|nr:GHKL domain-containing protein [Flavobacteriales bacterium]